MKKCAIITPGFLPVPAVLGGAVETLIEELVKSNEKAPKFYIDLYTVPNHKLNNIKFKYCNIIQVNIRKRHKMYGKIQYLIFRRILKNDEDRMSLFGIAVRELMVGKKYHYTIIENNAEVFNSIRRQKNMVFHLHNDLDNDRPPYLCKKIIKNCICTLSVSKYLAKRMNSIINSSKNKVLYNCVDLDLFNRNNVNIQWREEFKKNNNIKDGDFIYYFSGRIIDDKGVLELIKAFTYVIKKQKNAKLIIVGQSFFGNNELSKYEKDLYDIAKKDLDKIIFTGYINHNEIPNILSLADCVIIPTKTEEAFGVVALEAMAFGKAIIATNSGGLVEPLENNCAIIVEKKDLVNELINAMNKIYNNSDLKEKLGKSAYEKVHQVSEFDNKNYFKNFCEIIEGSEDSENRKFYKK